MKLDGRCKHGIGLDNQCLECEGAASKKDDSEPAIDELTDRQRWLKPALSLLHDWALVTGANGPITDPAQPLSAPSGRRIGDSCELIRRAWYVQETWLFEPTRPVLTHVYVEGLPLSSYRLSMPVGIRFGCDPESESSALLRHGLGPEWLSHVQPDAARTVRYVHNRFAALLADRWREEPLPKIDWEVFEVAEGPVTATELARWEKSWGIEHAGRSSEGRRS